MRDGIRLATDLYRPARDGELVPGPLADDRLHDALRQDRPALHRDRRLLRPARLRRRVAGHARPAPLGGDEATYFHSATPHTGRDGYDTIEWIATQPWSNGRTGTVGSSYAGITQVRTALESPPHLTAIWPDVVPTNTFQNQTREGGAMQLHMFWALYIHAPTRRTCRTTRRSRRRSGTTCANLRQLMWESPWQHGRARAAARPGARPDARRLLHARRLRRLWARKENDFTRYWHEHADIPATILDRLVRPLPARRREYFAAMAEKNELAAAARSSARGAMSACAATRPGRSTSTSASRRVWGVQRYFEEQLAYFDRWLREDAPGAPERRGAGPALRHGRRQRPQDATRASSTTAAAGATSTSGRSRAPCRRPFTCTATARCARTAAPRTTSRGASPTTPTTRCRRSAASTARSASSRRRAGARADVDAPAQPGAAAAEHHVPGPADQVESASTSPRACPTGGCPSAPTCSSTRPSRSPSRRGDRPRRR